MQPPEEIKMAKASSKKTVITVPATKEEKLKALDTACGAINRNYGKGAIMKLSDNANMEVKAIHTGSLLLDAALGIGGVPRGRVTEIYGPESSGKTTLALHIIAEAQKEGGIAAFIDAEHALDPSYAKSLGVDTDELLISQPDCGEDALEITETLVRSGAVDVVVIDSVAALVPKQELDGDMGANSVGVQARLMSKAMRKLASVISKTNSVVIFLNQLREKVGVMYGNPETTTGGRALKFAASVRIDIRKAEQLKQGSEIYGNKVKCKVVKNKVAPPFKIAEFEILYGRGISAESELIDLALKLDIIQKSGSWLSYGGERLGQGKDNVRKLLLSDHELFAEIEAKVRADMVNIVPDEEIGEEEDEDEFDLDILSDDDDIE